MEVTRTLARYIVQSRYEEIPAPVRHEAARALLNWSESDIVAVTRHLNDTIYRYRQTDDLVGLSTPRRR